jgi:hypothetical protein
MSEARKTSDHGEIKRWVELREGRPAKVKGVGKGEGEGLLRIDFQEPDESLQEISWQEFFAIFDKNRLAALIQDKTETGETSRFIKFVEP